VTLDESRERFFSSVARQGLDRERIARISDEMISHHRKGTTRVDPLEIRWYESLRKKTPDFSVYADDDYVAEVWACFVLYSRTFLRLIRTPPPGRADWPGITSDFPSPKRVADLGCGIGWSTAELKEMFPSADVVGTNVEGIQSRIAREEGARAGFRVVSNLEDVGTSDLVWACEYFEHFEQPIDHLREVLRILNPSALIYAAPFGSQSIGHFIRYDIAGDPRQGTLFGDGRRQENGEGTCRAFHDELIRQGFSQVITGLWNDTPEYWRRK
jgi:SAM-dependent methyltransferase